MFVKYHVYFISTASKYTTYSMTHHLPTLNHIKLVNLKRKYITVVEKTVISIFLFLNIKLKYNKKVDINIKKYKLYQGELC